MKYRILPMVLILFMASSFSLMRAQNISENQLKKNIQKRLDVKKQLIKDFQCEVIVKRVSDTPRGKMKMESNYILYFKRPDKRKLEFVGGKRGDKEINGRDKNSGGRKSDRGRMRRLSNEAVHLDLGKYLDILKIVGNDKIDGIDTYKISIKMADKSDKFKSATVWIDAKTFDVVKYKGKLRKNDRTITGKVVRFFAPIGPDGAWMPVREEWDRYMVFKTPMGKMDIETIGTTTFKNYQFNVGLKDEIFQKEK